MRWSFTIFGVTTLLWGFVQAPFFHVHAEDLDHDHGAGITHIHVRSIHSESEPEIEALTADDDAIDVVWSISAPSIFQFVLPLERAECITAELPTSLDAPIAPLWHTVTCA